MGAHIGVFNHQWFAKTDVNGEYTLPPLPAGKYTLTFWHEVFGEHQKQIELNKGQVITLNHQF